MKDIKCLSCDSVEISGAGKNCGSQNLEIFYWISLNHSKSYYLTIYGPKILVQKFIGAMLLASLEKNLFDLFGAFLINSK